MSEPPRRLEPTRGDRQMVVNSRTAGGSADGLTRYARPVSQSGGNATQQSSQPSSSGSDRISVFKTFAAAALTGTRLHVDAWDGTADDAGTSIQLNSPDDGSLYFFTEGTYAVTTTLKVDGLTAAAGAFSILALTNAVDFPNAVACSARGGDAALDQWAASSSYIYYSPGTGFSGGLSVDLEYATLDPAIVSVAVTVDVVLVSASA